MLTDEERTIIGWVVVDPDAWAAHAVATVGEAAIALKVARHQPAYEAASDQRSRAIREAES